MSAWLPASEAGFKVSAGTPAEPAATAAAGRNDADRASRAIAIAATLFGVSRCAF
jgi:hypothetical protein